ncbi:MAG: polysaccharide deacetylase family protein [Candidatus Bathyarchaeota archaeon]|nr:polysaccharide deacetylase family protein [Candidatus Bathyarchaeota archaeon]
MIHYHRMSPEKFREHILFLREKYNIISLQTLRDILYDTNGQKLPENSLIITFDDGWKTNYQLLPVIKEFDCPITIFLSTGLVGSNRKPGSKVIYDDFLINEDLLQQITRQSEETGIIEYFDYNSFEHERTMLSLEEIMEMSSYVEFQSHGVNHHVSTALPDYQLRYEIVESKKFIEETTGKEVYAIAYPYNEAGRREKEAVANAGYKLGRVGDRKLNSLSVDKYLINSIGIVEDCSIRNLRKILELAQIKTFSSWKLGTR